MYSHLFSSETQLPEEARALSILQLQTIAGVCRGLTRTAESLILEETSAERAEIERMKIARDDLRMVKLREDLFSAIGTVADLWSTDASVSDVCCCFSFTFLYSHC
jgi:hypothetical protein